MSDSEAWQQMQSEDEQVILVNSENEVIGQTGKIAAHQGLGQLHRAITVVLFDHQDRILVTQRSAEKPLWPDFWDAAASTHQWPGEDAVTAALRRLPFEIGVTGENLQEAHHYEYHAIYSDEWSENEINHIVVGNLDTDPQLNPHEASAFAWKTTAELRQELTQPNHQYVPWFALGVAPWL